MKEVITTIIMLGLTLTLLKTTILPIFKETQDLGKAIIAQMEDLEKELNSK